MVSQTCSCSSTICCGMLSLIWVPWAKASTPHLVTFHSVWVPLPPVASLKPLLALYGSIFTSILLVKVVWDKISGHTCRASVSSSPLLTDLFDGIQLVVGMYIKLFLVCIPRLGSPIHPFPLVVIPWARSRTPPSVYFVQRVRTR